MKKTYLRNILALLLSLGLGTVVLASSGDAVAQDYGSPGIEKQDDSSTAMPKSEESSSTAQKSATQSSEQKSKDFHEWTESEKPGDNVDNYASSGLMKLDDALSAVVDDVRKQPVGGGPARADSDKKEMKDEKAEMGAAALGDIKAEQQRLSKLAGELSGESEGAQNAMQFQQAATTTSQIFTSLQQARFADLEKDVKKVKEKADKIDATKPLAKQDKHVQNFFKESAKVLDKMSGELKEDAIGGGPSSDQEKSKDDDSSKSLDDSQMNNAGEDNDDMMPKMD